MRSNLVKNVFYIIIIVNVRVISVLSLLYSTVIIILNLKKKTLQQELGFNNK